MYYWIVWIGANCFSAFEKSVFAKNELNLVSNHGVEKPLKMAAWIR